MYMHKCIYHHPSSEYGLIPSDPVINHVTALVQAHHSPPFFRHHEICAAFSKYMQENGDANLP